MRQLKHKRLSIEFAIILWRKYLTQISSKVNWFPSSKICLYFENILNNVNLISTNNSNSSGWIYIYRIVGVKRLVNSIYNNNLYWIISKEVLINEACQYSILFLNIFGLGRRRRKSTILQWRNKAYKRIQYYYILKYIVCIKMGYSIYLQFTRYYKNFILGTFQYFESNIFI